MLPCHIVFEIYSSLWDWVERLSRQPPSTLAIYVYEQRTESGASFFDPEGKDGGPELCIHNPGRDSRSVRPVDDARVLTKLVTLSHEVGHATSWHTNADDAWPDYSAASTHYIQVRTMLALQRFGIECTEPMRVAAAAVVAELTERERDVIWREENRAWEIGERLLRERGFGDWEAFEERRAPQLRSYAIMLGRVKYEPCDFTALS